MLNRHYIRARVLESIYSNSKNDKDNIISEANSLINGIESTHELYVFLLNLMSRVHELSVKKFELDSKRKKHLQNGDLVSDRFTDNIVFKRISENEYLQEYNTKNEQLSWYLYPEYPKLIWDKIQDLESYKNYISLPKGSDEDEMKFIKKTFIKAVAENEKLHSLFESLNINWIVNLAVANTMALNTISKINDNFRLLSVFKNEDDRDFARNLFSKTLLNKQDLESRIIAKTDNWEKERIAQIDMIVMQMAVCELLYFPTIPTRVTLNEYIELAGEYSTQKSKRFVNGILDKIQREIGKK